MSLPEDEPLQVLIADDSNSDRLLLEAFVKKLGHRVITASDGDEAMQCFHALRPDIILLDALMPRMSGFAVAEAVKQVAGDSFIPIIFLTALTEADSLARCLEVGGDDFLTKPYNRVILEAKINAFRRMKRMHGLLQQQRDEIARYNRDLLREQDWAKRIFDKVARPDYLAIPQLRYSLSPLAMFNGDILLAAPQPSGNLLVLLGDFTGHGLAAAVGTMPLAQTFYSMAEKGFPLPEIVRELNRKLYEVLPTGVFCCACLVSVSADQTTVQIWNGGLPEVFVLQVGQAPQSVASGHLPLGVQPDSRFNAQTIWLPLQPGSRLLLRSDGVHETSNMRGEVFGEERLRQVLINADPMEAFESVLQAITDFAEGSARSDDVSLVELRLLPADVPAMAAPAAVWRQEASGGLNWSLQYTLQGEAILRCDPLPILLHALLEVPGLRGQAGRVHTVLSELYANALEHGLAQLDSSIKHSHEGFLRYYELKRERLAACSEEACVRISLQYRGDGNSGELTVIVQDSGAGFRLPVLTASNLNPERPAGRGLALVQGLCDTVSVLDPGNCVQAIYRWQAGQTEARR